MHQCRISQSTTTKKFSFLGRRDDSIHRGDIVSPHGCLFIIYSVDRVNEAVYIYPSVVGEIREAILFTPTSRRYIVYTRFMSWPPR